VRFRFLFLIGLIGVGIYLWNKETAVARTETQITEILSHSELGPAFERVVAESHKSKGLGEAQQAEGSGQLAGQLNDETRGKKTDSDAPQPLDFHRSKVEAEIDSVPLSPFEVPILRAFGNSHSGILLRRIIISRRYPGQVQGSEKLEDITLGELGQDPETVARVMAEVLSTLSKSEYREEHVTLWDLSNRIPGVHSRLQDLSPDEEFL
jgi:hypothetical protein